MMHTQAMDVPATPYDSAFVGAVAGTSAPIQLTGRQSARNIGRVDYDETKYTEAEFNERSKSPKPATLQTGPVIGQVPVVATCIPRLGRGLPSRAVHSAQATEQESPLDVFLRGGVKVNTSSINTTNRDAALATYAEAIAETFLRAASSSSTESDFSTKSVPNSPTASAASAVTATTTATAATVPINMVDAESAAASVSGLSKLYKIRENMNVGGAAATRALPDPSAQPACSTLTAPSATLTPSTDIVLSAPPVPSANANKQAPGDMDMPDAAGVEPIDEISTGGVLSDPFNQVFFFEKFSFHIIPVWNNMKSSVFILFQNGIV